MVTTYVGERVYVARFSEAQEEFDSLSAARMFLSRQAWEKAGIGLSDEQIRKIGPTPIKIEDEWAGNIYLSIRQELPGKWMTSKEPESGLVMVED